MTSELPSWLEKEKGMINLNREDTTLEERFAFNAGLVVAWNKTQERIELLKKVLLEAKYPSVYDKPFYEGDERWKLLIKKIDEVLR